MKIVQVIGSFSRGDGIGNHIWELHKIFCAAGYCSEIYSQYQNEKQQIKKVKNISELRNVKSDDILILHMCIGSMVNRYIQRFSCKKIMIYHNITPPEFFKKYDINFYRMCKQGYKELKQLIGKFDCVAAMSEYNKKDLLQIGYREPISVLSGYLIPYYEYQKEPDQRIIEKYQDEKKNFLFVGRVVPNKKQEDIIRVFAYYQKYFDSKVRLIFVGNTNLKHYVEDLKQYVQMIGVENVIFTGSVSFAELIAYYQIADIFLCMSEHEGFCIPLIEAMLFQVPVVTYKATAIPDTMGQAGVMMQTKKPVVWCQVIERVLNQEFIREKIILSEQKRVKERMEYRKQEKVLKEYRKILF